MVSYKELYEKVGSVVGWVFSKIDKRMKVFGEKWDFLEIVRGYVTSESILLDIGTGGGKKLLIVARFVKKAYGIDHQEGMIMTANENLRKSKMSNVEFKLTDAQELPFPKEYFSVVMCIHAPFYAKEVYRVLRHGGIFLTQQVYAEKDKLNIKRIFGRGQGFGREF
jgi:ubiquinone/menaquinone biosynthesis C-methylase UbiE